MKCPCGLDNTYTKCCAVYHTGKALPPTAQSLMRARYSAFVKNEMDFLSDTTDPQSLAKIDNAANKQWAEVAKFQQLEIVSAEESGNKGLVEFKAHYAVDDEDYIHHEVSTFRKQAGQWFFKSGKIKGEGKK